LEVVSSRKEAELYLFYRRLVAWINGKILQWPGKIRQGNLVRMREREREGEKEERKRKPNTRAL
jgi:hypothetical protein